MVNTILGRFKEGDNIFIPGSSAEPRGLTQAISENASQLPALHITHSFVPGINPLPLAANGNKVSETAFFPRSPELMHSGQVRFLPLSYYGARNYLKEQTFDWVVAHVSPPDESGLCSLGLSAEFMPTALNNARGIIGIINQQMPYLAGSPSIDCRDFDTTIEVDWPLVNYDVGDIDPVSTQIAEHLRDLVESGSILQVGLGKVPDKLVSSLTDKQNLRFHSGMLSDGFLTLAESGALDESFKHLGICALGSNNFYQRLADLSYVHIRGVEETHAPAAFSGYENFIAINSALEVDLWGQANLEMLGTRQISSVGGAADFARAARNTPNSKSVLALPATAAKGKISRIVPTLQPGQVVSLARNDIDYVVTEFGIAKLKGSSVRERGEALIRIAAPQFRDELLNNWQQLLNNS